MEVGASTNRCTDRVRVFVFVTADVAGVVRRVATAAAAVPGALLLLLLLASVAVALPVKLVPLSVNVLQRP